VRRANPVARSDLAGFFSYPAALRSLGVLLGILALVLYAWWPRGALAYNLRTTTPPQTFAAVALALLAAASYLNARAGAGEYAPPGETGLVDLVSLTPVPVASVVAGRLASGAVLVVFQLSLGLPFLLATLGVSGVSAVALVPALSVIGCSALAWRTSALAMRLTLPDHPLLRDIVLFASGTAFLVATFTLAPACNPVAALLDLAAGGARPMSVFSASLPFFAVSAIISALVVAAATAVSYAALRAARNAAQHGEGNDGNDAGHRA